MVASGFLNDPTSVLHLDPTRGLTVFRARELQWQLALMHSRVLPEIIFQNSLCWLMLVFLKAPFLFLLFFHHTLMTFLMMLLAKLLSMLTVKLSMLTTIRYLICCNNQRWLLNFNLTYERLGWGKNGLVDFNTENAWTFP